MSGALDAGSGLVPNAYADAFVMGPPREGVQRVQTRLHKARILTDELADYFAARRDLESNYLKSLQKIAKRSFLSDPGALGNNFLPVYERLIAEIGELARIHGDLEKKLEVECELPMRNASSKGEWAQIKGHDDNVSGTLKEIATLEQQLAKDQKKLEGASSKKASQAQQKVAETERSLRQTMELWETEARFSFEGYQKIDAQRLELMKEVVAKFETAQSDAAQQTMQMTEQSMQVALNFDPQADMQEFVLKNGTARNAIGRTARSGSVGTPSLASPSVALQGRTMTNATVQSAQSTHVPATNGLSEFGRPNLQRSSASISSMERTSSQQALGTTPSKTLGGSTLKSALTRFGRGRSNRNVNEGPSQSSYGALPENVSQMAPPVSTPSSSRVRGIGDDITRASLEEIGNTSTGAMSAGLMAPLTPRAAHSSAPPPQNSSSSKAPQVDEEGFTIPPANRDRKPWEMNGVNINSDALMDQEATESLDSAMAPKMTGMSIAQKPIAEDDASDQAALERMRSTLLTSRSPVMQAPQRRNTTRRDRRDVRNTTYNPMAAEEASRMLSASGTNGSTVAISSASTPSAFAASPGIGPERSQSMMSSGSASNIGNSTLDSIATNAPVESGLNAQIVERVNVMASGRNVSKIMIVGEISISARDVLASEPVHMRIDAFEQLEKAAPNPNFLQELAGQPGEYTMDLPAIVRASGASSVVPSGSKGRVTVLKYQLHVPAHRANEYLPLNVSPQWRCEDGQTSILVNYSANTDSRIASSVDPVSSISIRDVIMSVDVTSADVSNIMSKPTAIYAAEQKKLVWRLHEPVAISSTTTPVSHKALARFQVNEKSEIRPIEVRWKLSGATMSTLGLSLVDGGDVRFNNVVRQVVSGKYLIHP
jgi:hypothetical protein